MKKRILSVLLSLLMILTMVPQTVIFSSATVIESGKCGENLTYTLDDTGKLTISGTGNMLNYASWQSKKEQIKTVVIESGVTDIGDYAFAHCTNLTSVVIPEGVTHIGCSAFECCKSLTSVIIPNSITEISNLTFMWCINLTSVTIPNSVTSIGSGAFNVCWNLTSVTIPNSVTNIGSGAFAHCSSLATIKIPDSVTDIGMEAFEFCRSLTSITIPDSVTNIGDSVFSFCNSLSAITVNEKNVNYMSQDNVLFTKDKTKLIQYPAGKKNTEYIVPDSVTNIGDYAFYGCNNLTAISVSENNTNYMSSDGVLFNKDKTKLIQYPAGKKDIEYMIPDSVADIDYYAFYGCNNLTAISVSENNTNYMSSDGVLFDKNKTELIQYPAGKNNKEYTIPDSVTCVAYGAFFRCNSLTAITVGEKNTNYMSSDGVLFNKDKTELIKYPTGKNSMEYIIPDTVTSIYVLAFSGCDNLKSVVIGNGVKEICPGAFYDLTSLSDVYYNGSKEQWKKIYLASKNESLINADIHFNYVKPEHQHNYGEWTVAVPATCTEAGFETRVCSSCGAEETRVIPAAGHDWGNWIITKEATYTEEGLKSRICLTCGTEESCKIPVLKAKNTIKDEDREAYIKYDDNILNKGTKLDVEDEFDGTSFDLVNLEKGEFESEIYDITLTLNGKKVQPSGKVLVGIPLPDDYNPEKTYVYFVSEAGLKKLDSYVKNGIIWFEADHFSSYAVINEVEKTPEVKPQCGHMCHSTNPLMQFIWKIINFFNKLFKINQYCACGARHW